MRTIKLIIEYDGTNYSGWQVQPNGITIQQVLEGALEKLVGSPVRLHSSGRTDAGVHARGMVAVFRTEKTFPLRAFADGVNTLLPRDIAVREAADVPSDFNPRADATGKHYRYTIFNGARRSPLTRLYAWHLRERLDVAAMQRAAVHFVGERDFAAFRSTGCAAQTTRRQIYSLEVIRDGDIIRIEVNGSGFLRNMVRIMVGTLVETGLGKRSPEEIPALFLAPERDAAGMTAPPQGLCLMEVFY
jgi:tRNA pseudouridine38-40 synthase